MRSFPPCVAVPCLLIALSSSPSFGQDLAAADALFSKGLADMEAGKFDTGCPALAESYRLDPRPGTLFTLAECENKAGRVATASALYEDYLRAFSRMTPDQQAKQKGREQVATQQKTAIGPTIPMLTLVLPASAPRGTVVKRGDVTLGGPSLGLPLPVDPGEHVVTTQAPGGPVGEQRITIAKGEKKQLDLVVPAATSDAGGPTGAAPVGGPAPDAPFEPAEDPGKGRRTAAYVAGGIGIAGLAVGTITGILTLGKKSTIEDNCDGPLCNAEGKDAADSAGTLGLVSTIGFGVGIAGLATGAVLYFTAPKRREARLEPRIDVGTRDVALGVKGAW